MTSDSLGFGSGSAGVVEDEVGAGVVRLEGAAGLAGLSSARTDVVASVASNVAIDAHLVAGTAPQDRAVAKASTIGR
jgi:hypothetical protein